MIFAGNKRILEKIMKSRNPNAIREEGYEVENVLMLKTKTTIN